MPRLKRTRDEAELDIQIAPDVPPEKQELLSTLRNMWEFASFMQYLYLFGSAVKVDNDFDMEVCLPPIEPPLPGIYAQSHRSEMSA